MGLNFENVFGIQGWEYLRPDGLYKTYGDDGGTFAQMEKLGMAQVVATSAQNSTGTYADLDSMSISARIEAGQYVILNFNFSVIPQSQSTTSFVYIQLTKDGVAIDGTERYGQSVIWDGSIGYPAVYSSLSINYIDQNITGGIHTYKVQWKDYGNPAQCTGRIFNAIKTKPIED